MLLNFAVAIPVALLTAPPSREVQELVESIRVPAGAGEAHEIVGAALYLASDASRFTNGAIIKVDGGAVYGS